MTNLIKNLDLERKTNKKCTPDTLSGYISQKKNKYYSFLIEQSYIKSSAGHTTATAIRELTN